MYKQDNTTYTLSAASKEGLLNVVPLFMDHVFFPLLHDAHYLQEVFAVNGAGEDVGVVFSEMQVMGFARERERERAVLLLPSFLPSFLFSFLHPLRPSFLPSFLPFFFFLSFFLLPFSLPSFVFLPSDTQRHRHRCRRNTQTHRHKHTDVNILTTTRSKLSLSDCVQLASC